MDSSPPSASTALWYMYYLFSSWKPEPHKVVHYSLTLSQSRIFCKSWQPARSKRDHSEKAPLLPEILDLENTFFWSTRETDLGLSCLMFLSQHARPSTLSAVREQHRQGCSAKGIKPGAQGNPRKGQGTVQQHTDTMGRTGSIQALQYRAAGNMTSSKITGWIRTVHSIDKANNQLPAT